MTEDEILNCVHIVGYEYKISICMHAVGDEAKGIGERVGGFVVNVDDEEVILCSGQSGREFDVDCVTYVFVMDARLW